MRYHALALTFLLVISLFLTTPAAAQTASESPQKPVYHQTGNEATLVGTIGVVGTVPRTLLFDMTADPICVQLNREAKTDSLITNENRLLNAFVYVKNGDSLKTYEFELPASAVELRRERCIYSPHVLGLRVGQSLAIINEDPTHHNTHPTPRLNIEWNQTQPPSAQPIIKTFARPEVLIPFKCNHHPWEKAYVGVLDHPWRDAGGGSTIPLPRDRHREGYAPLTAF